jgi:hypothetical protein
MTKGLSKEEFRDDLIRLVEIPVYRGGFRYWRQGPQALRPRAREDQ